MIQEQASLYDRLGGIYNIASVVDELVNRVMDDPILNANPAVDEAHRRGTRPGFKYLVTEMVGWATGGPQQYSGRSMLDTHANLNISESEWGVFMTVLQETFDKFEVPQAEREDLVAIIDSTRDDIVVRKV